ncbi:hypothetical protein [Rhodanobacter sp. C01]|uniref:hypothetical protein n=1 Tax=Rhodanobacter sp. C01 TaxID=1945856 RepID=UPI000985A62F|nr:hypothetical protein [Rhodanobacter sp. C01]OOG50936.1 hypothetical protein B0E50_01725 [Rhodanobacter sp. C01]
MSYFKIMLSGTGISFPFEGSTALAIGFFTTRFVKAATRSEAQELAKEMVLDEWRQGGIYAAENRGKIPSLVIESVSSTGTLTGMFKHKVAGYTFYLGD